MAAARPSLRTATAAVAVTPGTRTHRPRPAANRARRPDPAAPTTFTPMTEVPVLLRKSIKVCSNGSLLYYCSKIKSSNFIYLFFGRKGMLFIIDSASK